MNWANRITIFRILLTPVFVGIMVYYKHSVNQEWLRFCALGVFVIAAFTDSLDGFIARVYAQQTNLGKILDPLADKLLVTSAVIMLSLPNESLGYHFPYWFTTLVISRDVLIILGIVLVHFITGQVTIKTIPAGKITTCLLIISIIWVLVKVPNSIIIISIAAVFVILSGLLYLLSGTRQLNQHLGK